MMGEDTPESVDGCVFCRIVKGAEPAEVVERWKDAIAIRPLNPVTPGHVLVIPCEHVTDALERPDVTARAVACAAELAEGPCNLITSVGAEATQTVRHLHWHIVPRRDGDGLTLPWTGQPVDDARSRGEVNIGQWRWPYAPACTECGGEVRHPVRALPEDDNG